MKVSEKTRAEIAMSIGTLSIKDAEKLVTKSGTNLSKVYKGLKLLRTPGANIDPEDEVMICLIELAAQRRPGRIEKQERFDKSMKQFSEKARKQAA